MEVLEVLCMSKVQPNGYASLPDDLKDAKSVIYEKDSRGVITVRKNGV